ncbi:MAG: preprotein translocase subunit SecG [Bacteriovoracia bacterium]
MSTIFIAFHIFVCIVLVLVVLVQAGKDGGIGMMGGGSSQTIFGSSGGANFFTKFTSVTAALFMVSSISLTLMKAGKKKSLFEGAPVQTSAPATPDTSAAPTPTPESAPANKH